VSAAAYLAELPSLVEAIDADAIKVTTDLQPLADVESVWSRIESPGVRTVFVP
jgi:hypothetical protein